MKRKVRKFAEGGFSAAQEEWLGGADRTDPYILARMRSAVPDEPAPKSRDFDAIDADMVAPSRDLTAPVTKTVSKTKVSVTKPKSTWEGNDKIPAMPETPEENKARMEGLIKKQALINVSPEDYVTPGGALKSMLKSVAGKGLKSYSARELADMAPKMIGRENLKLTREPLKLGMKKGGSVKKMSSGGKVKSASSRADGCAIRGKTRA